MKGIICVLALIAVAAAIRPRWNELEGYTFDRYAKDHFKVYQNDAEYDMRKQIFEDKLAKIKNHNKDSSKSWKEGVNHFTDRTDAEFQQLLGLDKPLLYTQKASITEQPFVPKVPLSELPTDVDWRKEGIITAVKDQGQCGSCWSFGSAESVESYWALACDYIGDLSEQQILDCIPNPNQCGGTGGCGGGTPELAFAALKSGISSEWTYPYVSWFGENFECQTNNVNPTAYVVNFTVLPANQLQPVLEHLATVGPLAVNVEASTWSGYESGVFDGCNKANPDIDHVVQLVGYGTDSNLGDYWLVRNSWSPLFGEQGYIRLKRNSTPQCGVDIIPSDGTGCKGGPANVTVCGTCGILYDTSFPGVACAQSKF